MTLLSHPLPRLALFAVCMGVASVGKAGALLPDLERGIAAFEAGDLDAAEEDLLPLAQSNYPQARVRLARLYMRRGTKEAVVQAIHWYRTAMADGEHVYVDLARALMAAGVIDSEVDRLLQAAAVENEADTLHLRLRLYRTRPDLDLNGDAEWLAERAASSEQIDNVTEALSWYRLHADKHGPRIVELCTDWLTSITDCYVDLAKHYRAGADTESLAKVVNGAAQRFEKKRLPADTIEAIAHALMSTELPGDRNPPTAYRLLTLVENESPTATTRMARLLIEDPSLDPGRSPRELLDRAYAQGVPEAALYLGRLYLDPQSPQSDPVQAQTLLNEATAATPAAHFYLGRLYERGYLGRSDPDRALNHYLLAARSGYAQADLELARFFWTNRGVKVNPVNAYCFAHLAEQAGVPGAREFLEELKRSVEPRQVDEARQKAGAESIARNQALPAADPAQTASTRVEEMTP